MKQQLITLLVFLSIAVSILIFSGRERILKESKIEQDGYRLRISTMHSAWWDGGPERYIVLEAHSPENEAPFVLQLNPRSNHESAFLIDASDFYPEPRGFRSRKWAFYVNTNPDGEWFLGHKSIFDFTLIQ